MQFMILALALVLFAHDQFPEEVWPVESWWLLGVVVLTPKLVLSGGYLLACITTKKRLGLEGGVRRLRRLESLGGAYRIAGLVLYTVDLYLGLLVHVRAGLTQMTGFTELVLVDEFSVMLPTLIYWGIGWWAYYPIERWLREAGMIRQLDDGLAAYPILTRWQYLISQYRHQIGLILVPLLCVLGWAEAVELAGPGGQGWLTDEAEPWVMIAGCLAIFLAAPLMIRLIWDTVPLPDGEIRTRLLAMCKTHRVRVRELLLWRTHGGMINAAVMGLIGPLRYILITDALLQQMPGLHVEAVMAHELAHVRKRHMLWLLVTAVGLISVIKTLAVAALSFQGDSLAWLSEADPAVTTVGAGEFASGWLDSPQALVLMAMAASVVAWAWCFGWVSRRIERQADSFAVAHMVRQRGGGTVEYKDTQAMINALQHVADLNHIRVDKHSWRHGSIAWRQGYLRSLVGSSIDRLPIDRQMRWINGLCLTAALAVFAWQAGLG